MRYRILPNKPEFFMCKKKRPRYHLWPRPMITNNSQFHCVKEFQLFKFLLTGRIDHLHYFPVFHKSKKEFFVTEIIWNFAEFMTAQGKFIT